MKTQIFIKELHFFMQSTHKKNEVYEENLPDQVPNDVLKLWDQILYGKISKIIWTGCISAQADLDFNCLHVPKYILFFA